MSKTKSPAASKSAWEYYYGLTRLKGFPIGTVFIFWPSAWGLGMAAYSNGLPMENFVTQTLLFAVGSTLLHASVCVLNDICDRDIDRKVERTKDRPLARGVVPIGGAAILTVLLLCATLGVLSFANSRVIIYSLMDVVATDLARLSMGWGLFPGWISVAGSINPRIVVVFYVGSVCWTIVYDTIYACQDRKDDLMAGVGSAALVLGSAVRPILSLFATAFLGCMVYAGLQNSQGPYFFIVSVGGAALFFLWVFLTWEVDNNEDCLTKIIANGNMGVVIWTGIFLDYYFKTASVT
ncbi:UbiA prenyltransferase family-domain-containing protein [Mycena rebaudengoi]|nr:UbiA prenyltransferase family-domain-containing protein [Mycena rebaudengoi]